ncbi:MAG: rRNA (adenine1518-N6/adenine1519-N6)-dimethyltransferase [Actinomycetota bacterium]|nr:rRNA (adenine1518-N6/adenine1519-N6)-dimethyltransferase [Actinomycetota bacterium]
MGARKVRELLDRHDIRPTKSLGQNFVVDPNTIRKTLAAAGIQPSDHVLEIGAGAGSLTLGLAAGARKVTAVEVDPRLIPLLAEVMRDVPNVEVVHEDALGFDPGSVGADSVVANLPYNIATLVVLRVLELASTVRSLTVMTQREVGERLSAAPGTKIYGQTSVMVAYYGEARVATTVSRRAFWPVPGVDSVIVRIDRKEPPAVDRELLFKVIRAAFAQRRKTLRQTLSIVAGSPALAQELLERIDISHSARAEELGLDDFVSIARALDAVGSR